MTITTEQPTITMTISAIPKPCDDGHLYGCPTHHARVGKTYWCDACLTNEARDIARLVAYRQGKRGAGR